MKTISIKQKLVISIIMLFFVISINSAIYAKYVIDNAFTIATINIDRTAPSLQVSYSETEPTENDVIVIIIADEIIQPVDGWELSEDRKSIFKTYTENKTEPLNIEDLYNNMTNIQIVVDNIDKDIPQVNLIEISNNNLIDKKYANCKQHILFSFEIIESNIKNNNFLPEKFDLYVDDNIIENVNINIDKINEIKYNVSVTNLQGNGKLKLVAKDGIIIDSTGKTNEQLVIDTGIIIDNIAPEVRFEEISQNLGKSIGKINVNEKITNINGWTKNNDLEFQKEFESNVLYEMNVSDLADNISKIMVNISKATYINISYCSHNSEVGWTYGNGVNQIAGENAIKINPTYKTESLAFNISGNIDSDFVRMRGYVHHYWGEGTRGVCRFSNNIYYYGYNPSNNSWKSMASNDLININGNKYFQFGGANINGWNQLDENSENPLPLETALKYLYGISGITMDLKDYSYYSIVYQIYVDKVGWMETKADGQEAVYLHDKPMSAIRMNIVPKTEKQRLIEYWNKDC